MIWLTVHLKEGTMGKGVKWAMIQFTLVKAGIIELNALENQGMAFDTICFIHWHGCHILGLIY